MFLRYQATKIESENISTDRKNKKDWERQKYEDYDFFFRTSDEPLNENPGSGLFWESVQREVRRSMGCDEEGAREHHHSRSAFTRAASLRVSKVMIPHTDIYFSGY